LVAGEATIARSGSSMLILVGSTDLRLVMIVPYAVFV